MTLKIVNLKLANQIYENQFENRQTKRLKDLFANLATYPAVRKHY